MITRAWQLASYYHRDQKYGPHPYMKHLKDAYDVAIRFNVTDENTLIAVILHDSLENTTITENEILTEFGPIVLDLVKRVTDEPGATRKERAIKTYPKIKASAEATVVKLCDRIANMESSRKNSPDKFKMYLKELPKFNELIKVSGIADDMWLYLNSIKQPHIENLTQIKTISLQYSTLSV